MVLLSLVHLAVADSSSISCGLPVEEEYNALLLAPLTVPPHFLSFSLCFLVVSGDSRMSISLGDSRIKLNLKL